ncbi:hypothetical protein BJQ94_13795 [Cryobacterium sp. SO2]|uniref:hypothetical protein n=1 Tax=Cryobacterium sp. SO2 TaxID=1897060 RepID=UPI00223CE2A2|nr:hypothetical protein [Cryobacterium sp. SO2]WEO76431.1 hypothetical protein BJQ94_13795 [Cryobacterium sp. SO2]
MARVAQSDDELRQHLREQIGFLRDSCVRFDEGKTEYAKQASLTLRVLLHDTRASRSLLGLLGLKNKMRFLDSAGQMLESNLATSANLVTMRMTITDEHGSVQPSYVPVLDDYEHRTHLNRLTAFGKTREPAAGRALDFDDWWDLSVVRDDARNDFSRRQLVLALCNQDGGGHIDPEVDAAYYRLTRSNSLGYATFGRGDETAFGSPVPGSVRQIGHEVLRSIPRSWG